MIKVISIIIILLVCFLMVVGLIYWLVTTPKTAKFQPLLEERANFDYDTSFMIQKDSSTSERLLLRRVRNSDWRTSGPHTDYQEKTEKEASMAVSTIRVDAYLKQSPDELSKIIVGRYDDRGSGMHGWHVTMIKQGESEINFDRHQRYYVWIEKEFPKGFDEQGEPISENSKRWFFAGLADLIAKEKYNGYVEPVEGDK